VQEVLDERRLADALRPVDQHDAGRPAACILERLPQDGQLLAAADQHGLRLRQRGHRAQPSPRPST
jgi:hypothetical protein